MLVSDKRVNKNMIIIKIFMMVLLGDGISEPGIKKLYKHWRNLLGLYNFLSWIIYMGKKIDFGLVSAELIVVSANLFFQKLTRL